MSDRPTVERHDCPQCHEACRIAINLDDAIYAQLDDRLVMLNDVPCSVFCRDCGYARSGTIRDLDISMPAGRMEFGSLILD